MPCSTRHQRSGVGEAVRRAWARVGIGDQGARRRRAVQYEVVGGLELRPDGVARALVEARRVEGSVGREHGARGGVGVARGKFADGLGLAQEVGYESDLLGTKTGVGLAYRAVAAEHEVARVGAVVGGVEQGANPRVEHGPKARGPVVAAGEGLAHGTEHRRVARAGQGLDEGVLGGKLQVHRADADAGLAGDVGHGGLRGAVVPKEALGGGENRVASVALRHRGVSSLLRQPPWGAMARRLLSRRRLSRVRPLSSA
jgi:hypothetical protein